MHRFGRKRRVEKCAHEIDGDRFARHQRETGGRVHPGVDADHEDRGGRARDGDRDGAKPMGEWRDFIPAVEIDADENRLDEESEALGRKRDPDDRSGLLHELRPEQTELERQRRSRDGADREE